MSKFSVKWNPSGDSRIIWELGSEFSCKYFGGCFSWTLPHFFHISFSNAVCPVPQIWKTTPNKIVILKNTTAISMPVRSVWSTLFWIVCRLIFTIVLYIVLWNLWELYLASLGGKLQPMTLYLSYGKDIWTQINPAAAVMYWTIFCCYLWVIASFFEREIETFEIILLC